MTRAASASALVTAATSHTAGSSTAAATGVGTPRRAPQASAAAVPRLDALEQRLSTIPGTAAGQLGEFDGPLYTVIDPIGARLADLGAQAKQIERHTVFVSKLSDSLETGIGNLVDADLAKESARLQALQVQQQLGVQALSIANQAPQVILSLFQG